MHITHRHIFSKKEAQRHAQPRFKEQHTRPEVKFVRDENKSSINLREPERARLPKRVRTCVQGFTSRRSQSTKLLARLTWRRVLAPRAP
jgi:hypothetical protein